MFVVNILVHASGRVKGLGSQIQRLYDVYSRFYAPKLNNNGFVQKLQFPTPLLFFDVAWWYIELASSVEAEVYTDWCKHQVESYYRLSRMRIQKLVHSTSDRLLYVRSSVRYSAK